jgi:serine/threonine protein phosphatase PrpC
MKRRASADLSKTVFEVGGPVTDVGNKYVQSYGSLTLGNVRPVRGSDLGIRMEDYAVVERTMNPIHNSDVTTVIVTDGHGSVPAYSRTGHDKDAERWIGGYEIARLGADSINQYVKRVSDFLPLHTLDRSGMARVLYDSFAYAQKRCEQETVKGGRSPGSTDPFDRRRLEELMSSGVDGWHFRALFRDGTVSKNPWIDPRCLIVDKIVQPYGGGGGNVTYYVDGSGKRRVLAEYGCTATAAIFVPCFQRTSRREEQNPVGTLYLGHTGDTDAYLFYRRRSGYDYVRLTGDHSVSNQKEVERLRPYGMRVRPPYFTLTRGPEAGQSLMPSRSLGHSLLSKHGISYEPTVATTALCSGDVVIIATDGLWASYGASKARPREKISDEDLSAAMVADIVNEDPDASPDVIAERIRDDVEKTVSRRDNLAVVVVKVKG